MTLLTDQNWGETFCLQGGHQLTWYQKTAINPYFIMRCALHNKAADFLTIFCTTFVCHYSQFPLFFYSLYFLLFTRIKWVLFLGSYFTYWFYKCYNPIFLDRTVGINVFHLFFKKFNFLCDKKIFWDKTSTYIGKLEKNSQTVRIIGLVRIIGT